MSVELLLALGGAVATLIGGFWAVATIAGKQFEKRLDERFASQKQDREAYEKRLEKVEEKYGELDRAFLKHLADLPVNYMRREDHIRFETVINAKLDALAAKQDLLAERLPRRD